VLCGYHFILFGVLGLAWSSVLPPSQRIAVRAFIWGRIIRDSGSEVLPLSQIGGIVMSTRAATLAGVPPTAARGLRLERQQQKQTQQDVDDLRDDLQRHASFIAVSATGLNRSNG
jgi:hypothetical protein